MALIPLPPLVPHFLAVRGSDRVYHHEIAVVDDGKSYQLRPRSCRVPQPHFSYLPDLAAYYSLPRARPGVSFVLRDSRHGSFMSLASYHRSAYDSWNRRFLSLPVPPAVHPGLIKRATDTLFDNLFEDLLTEAIETATTEYYKGLASKSSFAALERLLQDMFSVGFGDGKFPYQCTSC